MLQNSVYEAVNKAVEAEMTEGPTGLDANVQLVNDDLEGISEEDSEVPSSVREKPMTPAPIKVMTKAERERAELTAMIKGTVNPRAVDPLSPRPSRPGEGKPAENGDVDP